MPRSPPRPERPRREAPEQSLRALRKDAHAPKSEIREAVARVEAGAKREAEEGLVIAAAGCADPRRAAEQRPIERRVTPRVAGDDRRIEVERPLAHAPVQSG